MRAASTGVIRVPVIEQVFGIRSLVAILPTGTVAAKDRRAHLAGPGPSGMVRTT